MDESATGSVNLWSTPLGRIAGVPHFRLPSIDHGVTSFLWALGLGVFIWAGLLAVGAGQAFAFIVAALAGFFIFLYVRLYGDEQAPQATRSRGRTP